MGSGVLAFAEQRNGELKKTAFEVTGLAKRLAGELGGEAMVVVIGSGVEGLAGELASRGAQKVIVVDQPELESYSTEGYAAALKIAIEKVDPAAVVLSATAMGKDLGPRVAAELKASLASDVTDVQVDGGTLTVKRPVYSGKAIATLKFTSALPMISVRPTVFTAPEPSSGEAPVEKLTVADLSIRAVVKEVQQSKGDQVELTEASVVVSGGRGLKGPEHWGMIEELADVLGAALGASRAVVDAGWRPHSEQVGQTGKIVSPKLYFAIGISGMIQHLAGMSTSETIVAINKDADAPIHKVATYSIIGDAFEIVPRLIEELKKG
ncbi:MAG: electron transfer flavoprotein subunit alpha/FixB family protein [Planctomycetota bacterium]